MKSVVSESLKTNVFDSLKAQNDSVFESLKGQGSLIQRDPVLIPES